MKKVKSIFVAMLLCVMLILMAGLTNQVVGAEKYPTRAIDIIVPFGQGGSTDLATRILADELKKMWGVPVNVVNKLGGNGIPGTMEALNAKPDGYTILADSVITSSWLPIVAQASSITIPERTYLALTVTTPFIFYVPASSPMKTMKDLEAEIKKDPGAFTWPSGGGASAADIAVKQFFNAIGVDINKTRPVPMQSAAQSVTLIGSGAVKVCLLGLTSGITNTKAGIIKPIGVASKKRVPEIQDVPTTAEAGYPSVEVEFWSGLSGPAKMPADIIDIWSKAIADLMKNPNVLSKIKATAAIPYYHNAAEFKTYVARETDAVIKLYELKK
jgi:tripartite-type tricarboxylate transporter receptor subunit TctC